MEIKLSEETSKREKEIERHKRLRKDCQVYTWLMMILIMNLSDNKLKTFINMSASLIIIVVARLLGTIHDSYMHT